MKYTTSTLTRGFHWLCAAFALTASVQAQFTLPSSPPSLPPGAPAPELWQKGEPTVRFGTDIYRDVMIRTLDKVVSFEWRYANPQLPSTSNVLDRNSEVFGTRYWPTFALPIDNYHLCVAGKGLNGSTTLELWTFGTVSSGGTPAPGVIDYFPTGGGPPNYVWTLPPRTQVDGIVHLAVGSPQGPVRGLIHCQGTSSKVLAFYDTSRELALVDVQAKTQFVIASPVGGSNVMAVPALANSYQRFWSADYVNKGYCYFFGPVYGSGTQPLPDFLVLMDNNRDGKLDAYKLITGTEWTTDGWGDSANLVQPQY